MLNYDLITLAKLTKGKLVGENLRFSSVSISSKNLQKGALFIAIKGERFDGHEFIEDAIKQGAVAALSEKPLTNKIPHIQVTNTRLALGKLAAFHRKNFKNPVIGLTGSMGKTTTKAMIAAILRQHHEVLSPEASMNNEIGVPLTLLELKNQDFAIIEMGTNHQGEIEYLTNIAKPDVALITNIGAAHLEALKTLEGVAKEKSTIFEGLSDQGVAVINRDDAYAHELIESAKPNKIKTFGFAKDADISAKDVKLNDSGKSSFILTSKDFEVDIHLNCYGEHNIKNALAAAAVAHIYGIPVNVIKAGLESVEAVSKRLKRRMGLNESVIIDDSYSAIFDAVTAALKVLACAKGEKIFIFGGMAELNPEEKITLHESIGEQARELGVNQLLAVGALAKHTVEAFGNSAKHFENKQQLMEYTKPLLNPSVTVLVKGSRGMGLEEVVNGLSL